MKRYHKLVRDKIPEILDKKGIIYEKSIASDPEFKRALIAKLLEESQEFADEGDVAELADVLEVIEALRKLPEYQKVEDIKKKKREERGSFDLKIILTGEK